MYKHKFLNRAALLAALMGLPLSLQAALAPATPQGTITAYDYDGIGGTAISDLTNNVKFPIAPDAVNYPTLFEWPSNSDGTPPLADNKNDYGTMIHGWVYPPTTGNYTFYLAADDNARLFLSTDENPANKQLLAQETEWNPVRAFTAIDRRALVDVGTPDERRINVSKKVSLQAGKAYYIEALMKEGGGGDNLAVAWSSNNVPPTLPIPGEFLSPVQGPAQFITQPVSQTVQENLPVTFSINVIGTMPFTVQWRRDGEDIPDATGVSYTIPATLHSDSGAVFTAVVSNAEGEATSAGATLTVSTDAIKPTITKVSPETDRSVVVVFSEPVADDTGLTTANYNIAGLAITSVARVSPLAVRLETAKQTANQNYTLTVNGVTDIAAVPNALAANTTVSFQGAVLVPNSAKFEYFGGITGSLANLTNTVAFQSKTPSIVGYLPTFNSRGIFPDDSHDNYGARMTALISPTTTGDYRFFINSDDASTLWLSTDENPANLVEIATEAGCCTPFTEPEVPTTSAPITLQAGQKYFLQLIYKEGAGGDYGQVAWRNEADAGTIAASALTAIPGSAMSSFADPGAAVITISSQPVSGTTTENGKLTFTVAATATPSPVTYQWQRAPSGSSSFVNIAGATSASYTTDFLKVAADHGAQYRVVISVPGKTATSDTVTSTVTADTTIPTVLSATANLTRNQVLVRFSEPVLAAEAGNAANYSIPGLTVSAATIVSPDLVRLTTSAQANGAPYTLTISNVKDTAAVPNVISAVPTVFYAPALLAGQVKFEAWNDISGTAVSELLNNPRYQAGTSDFATVIAGWDSRLVYPDDSHENYGARLTGFISPETTGDYRFFIRSDDASRLWVSTDDTAANLVQVADEPGCCAAFMEPPNARTSEPRRLEAGKRYFVQLVYKEGGGGDFGQVAIRNEEDFTPAAELLPLSGSQTGVIIDPATVNTTFTTQPVSVTQQGNTRATFTAVATSNLGPISYQWQRAASGSSTWVNVAGATSGTFRTDYVSTADNGARYRLVARVPGKETTSAEATLTVTPDTTAPRIVSATAGRAGASVTLVFSEPMTAAAGTAANYTINGLAVSGVTVLSGDTVRLTTAQQVQGTNYTLTVAAPVVDPSGNAIAAGFNTANVKTYVQLAGALSWEAYTGIAGGVVTDLRNSSKYPNSPDDRRILSSYEGPTNYGDNYGSRISGFVIPPTSGNYVFYLAADDNAELYLSTDDEEANKQLIATEPIWNGVRDWTGTAQRTLVDVGTEFERYINVSRPIALVAGRRYYTEVLHKEGGGGDNLAVAMVEEGGFPDLPVSGDQIATSVLAETLPVSQRTALGTGNTPGFKFRVYQVNQVGTQGLPNTYDRAEQQLAGLFGPNVANLTGSANGVFSIAGVINFSGDYTDGVPNAAGGFTETSETPMADAALPGIPGTGATAFNTDQVAGEVIGYVEFPTAGVYVLGVNSDDGFRMTIGDQVPTVNGALVVSGGGAGTYAAISGALGQDTIGSYGRGSVTGTLVAADPVQGCTPFNNAAAVAGNIVLVDRGGCTFEIIVNNAIAAGATGVVIVNNRLADSAEGRFPVVPNGSYRDIPVVMIENTAGVAIRAGLNASSTATIGRDQTPTLGVANYGRGATDTTFAVRVAEAGVYPIRTLWWEGGGGANLEIFSVNSEGTKVLLNDLSNPTALKVFQDREGGVVVQPSRLSISRNGNQVTITWTNGGTLQSSTSVTGPYTNVAGATGGTYTTTATDAARFFRVVNNP